ncbi:hypothetical protein SLEP1_g23045 [Rubroshorea leprosula]|uniref:Uncharacterized protein n=1 Tax=Rubroshorea leprosula TaxID=152421 RepID=A0AAV5JGF4_9ROSI|nr:hypothetical protein SLEP1_g23045 [Rubroshorea leprosula]
MLVLFVYLIHTTCMLQMVALKDTGRQVLTYGERKPAEHLLKLAEVITLKDISSIAQKLLSSLLTMASYGNVYYLLPYDIVSDKFKSKMGLLS